MLNKNPKLNKKDFQNKENFALIDIFKLFFALCIVGLHTGFLYNYAFGYYVHTIIFRLGVPFFFIASGYFLAKKDVGTNQKNICLDFIKKLLPMYLLLGTTYIILFAIRYNDFSASSLLINFWYLITGRSLSVMWYVGALITSAIILLHLNTKKKLLYSLILFLVLYIIGLLFNTYSFLLINGTFDFIYRFLVTQFHSNSNFLFVGFLFFFALFK